MLRIAEGEVERVIGDVGQPSAVEFHGGELWVSDFIDGSVYAYDLDGNRLDLVRDNRRSAARLEEPCAMHAADGEVWVLGNDSRNLLVLGDDEREYGRDRPLRSAHGFALHDDRIYVATSPTEWGLGLVQVLDAHTGERLGDFGPWGELEDGTGLAVDGDTLLVTDWFGHQVVRYSVDGEWLGVVADASDGLDRPVSVQVHDGVAYVLDGGGVWRIDSGGMTRVAALDLAFGRNLTIRDVPSR